jgi:hypothetical protein
MEEEVRMFFYVGIVGFWLKLKVLANKRENEEERERDTST